MIQRSAGKGGSVREAGDAVQFDEISLVLIVCLNFGGFLGLLARQCLGQGWHEICLIGRSRRTTAASKRSGVMRGDCWEMDEVGGKAGAASAQL
ncbi:MAG: hypothetical protein ACREP4_13765 [Stenotrophomonas sp.]|uniref:hypothetical protein n=1 Tax=Stenotrophomonas sp. TaxID=69392 RepID=UPI003D6CBB0D